MLFTSTSLRASTAGTWSWGTGSRSCTPRATSRSRSARSSAVEDVPKISYAAPASVAARAIASYPLAGEVRPSETARSGSTASRSTGANAARSIPWPIATTFPDGNGNERSSTLRTAVASRSASTSVRLRFQWVNQSSSGTWRGRVSGAARIA